MVTSQRAAGASMDTTALSTLLSIWFLFRVGKRGQWRQPKAKIETGRAFPERRAAPESDPVPSFCQCRLTKVGIELFTNS